MAKARMVWIIEHRFKNKGMRWSDWICTFDDKAGPYDRASLARKNKPLNNKEWQFRVVRYDSTK